MAGLLDGIKVLEVANWVAAPSACAMLADMGAEVIKVEPVDIGDPVRNINSSTRGIVPYEGGLNSAFELLNRGKQSIAVDLGNPQGQVLVQKLAARADVMVTNLVPQRQVRYNLRYEDVSADNPRIIYLSLTGYGREGPERDRLGFDYAAFWARSGIMSVLGDPDGPPANQKPGMGDQATSLAITSAIAVNLFARERTGKGQRIDCSLLHTGMWVLGLDMMAALKERQAPPRISRKNVGNPLFNYYQAKDGKWIQMVMIEADRFWSGFCRALGLEELENDARFDTLAARAEHNQALIRIIEERIATKTRIEWADSLDNENCIWAPVQTLDEVIVDPQVEANGFITSVDHPNEGAYQVLNAPMQFAHTPTTPAGAAPELGQHTESVLLDIGYTWDDIAALKGSGAIN